MLLRDAPKPSSSDLAKDLTMRRDTVKDYLKRLKKKGLLVREGTGRVGTWRLTHAGKAALEE